MIEARIEGMPERGVTEKVIDSLHSRDGLYCVDLGQDVTWLYLAGLPQRRGPVASDQPTQ